MSEKRMSLGAVTKGRIAAPVRCLIYGVPGVGKSTFGGDAPDPIFLPVENGTNQLDVARFPKICSWTEAMDALDVLAREQHAYRTVVIDTLDELEPLCWAHVVATKTDKLGKKHDSIEGFGYGDGYAKAAEVWREMLIKLDVLHTKMNVVLVAHSHVKLFKNPEGEDFERFTMKLHKTANEVIKQWSDCQLFAAHEKLTHKKNERDVRERAKGLSTGARLLHTQETAAYDAKNRYGLPPTLPLQWEAFAEAVKTGRTMPAVDIREQIAELLRDQPAALAERVNAALVKSKDEPTVLAKILNQLRATVAPKESAA